MYIAELGFAYGGVHPMPRILKVDSDGSMSVLVDRGLNSPISDIECHDGKIFVSHHSMVSLVDAKTGMTKDIVVAIPNGDHHNDEIEIGPDGRVYLSIGTVTNSGVVGLANIKKFGWPKLNPGGHEVPGKDVTLTGQNLETPNLLSPETNDTATTGAFVPFGNAIKDGQVVKGNVKCSGCIISFKPDGTDLKLVAWGLRNPYNRLILTCMVQFGAQKKKRSAVSLHISSY